MIKKTAIRDFWSWKYHCAISVSQPVTSRASVGMGSKVLTFPYSLTSKKSSLRCQPSVQRECPSPVYLTDGLEERNSTIPVAVAPATTTATS